jgi:GTPase
MSPALPATHHAGRMRTTTLIAGDDQRATWEVVHCSKTASSPAGSVDDGKSTLIGRLLFDSRGHPADS